MLGYGELQVLRQAEQILCSGLQLQRFDIKFYKTDIVHIELSALLLIFLWFIGCVCEGRREMPHILRQGLLLILPLCCGLANS